MSAIECSAPSHSNSNCPEDNGKSESTSSETSCQDKIENANETVDCADALLPTAEDCAHHLASIFNSLSAAKSMTPRMKNIDEKIHLTQPSLSTQLTETNCNIPRNDPKTPANCVQIGSGGDFFDMKISIEKCHDLFQLDGTSPVKTAWLSYRCFGSVIQSEVFTLSESIQHASPFTPMMKSFCIRSSLSELVGHFNRKKNGMLRIHVCTEGEVLGTASVNLYQMIPGKNCGEGVNSDDFEGRMVENEYIVKPPSRSATNKECSEKGGQHYAACSPRIGIRLFIDRHPVNSDSICGSPSNNPEDIVSVKQQQSTAAIYSFTPAQKIKVNTIDRASSPIKRSIAMDEVSEGDSNAHPLNHLQKREDNLKAREDELSKKEKEIHGAVASLDKKRCEWEQWRHRQELEWHEKLRNKEAAMTRVVEERVSTIERERLSSMEASKNEYEKLEARLRKALIEVEAKERQLKDIELGHQNERKRKLAELELREKLMREELKHSVDIERAKVNAAVEQAVTAEKSSAAANKKVKQIETEMDQLREQHRKTPEVKLMHELAELKGQLAESERRVEYVKAEKNQAIAEKEQFRSNVHKLARALRHEREKAKAIKKENRGNQEVRLSYDANVKSFVLDGGQDEIQRILTDLNKISQVKGQAFPSPMTSPMATQSCNVQQFESDGGMLRNSNNMPPMPSPQPSHPVSTHSPNQNQPSFLHPGYGMEPSITPNGARTTG